MHLFCNGTSVKDSVPVVSYSCRWRTVCTYGGLLQIYCTNSHKELARGGPLAWGLGETLTRGGPLAWGLGETLTTPQHKNQQVTKCYTWGPGLGFTQILSLQKTT